MADFAGKRTANPLAREFANEHVSKLPLKEWEIKSDLIQDWLRIRGEIGRSTQRAGWRPSDSEGLSASTGELRLRDFPRFPNWLDQLRERIKPDELAKQGIGLTLKSRVKKN
jgi:hypothetical protein